MLLLDHLLFLNIFLSEHLMQNITSVRRTEWLNERICFHNLCVTKSKVSELYFAKVFSLQQKEIAQTCHASPPPSNSQSPPSYNNPPFACSAPFPQPLPPPLPALALTQPLQSSEHHFAKYSPYNNKERNLSQPCPFLFPNPSTLPFLFLNPSTLPFLFLNPSTLPFPIP